MGELVRALVLPDLPRGFDPERAGEEAEHVLRELDRAGEAIRAGAPDAVVVAAADWVTTFHHYVAGAARFAERSVGGDAGRPGALHRGHPTLARALVDAGRAGRVPAVLTEEPVMPLAPGELTLLGYLLASTDVPLVPVSLCYLADLGETLRWGRAIGATVRDGPWRVVLAVSRASPKPRGVAGHCAFSGSGGPRRASAGAWPLATSASPGRTARDGAPVVARQVALLSGALRGGLALAAGPAALRPAAALGLSPN